MMRKVGLYSRGCPSVNFPNCVDEGKNESLGSLYNKLEDIGEAFHPCE